MNLLLVLTVFFKKIQRGIELLSTVIEWEEKHRRSQGSFVKEPWLLVYFYLGR